METTNKTPEQRIKKGFEQTLNRHGYGFQYSVLQLAFTLSEQGKSKWVFEAAEFPVQVQGYGTRIDFILQNRHKRVNAPFYLLAECKRANPALYNWCFARAPFVVRNRSTEYFFIERAHLNEDKSIHASAINFQLTTPKDAYHIAQVVKSNKKGDSGGEGRGVIEEAVTQVCRGLNGMIEFLSKNTEFLGNETDALFLPVVFTTAQLWVSDINLGLADIESGNINLSEANLTNKPWIFYQYPISPGLKHSHSPIDRPQRFGALMDSEYIRTIPIVSASGIEAFLGWASDPVNLML